MNTLLLQRVLADPAWAKKLSDEDRRGLTALFWSNINPYGTFRLDMNKRLALSGVTIPGQRAAVSERAEAAPGHPLSRMITHPMGRQRLRMHGRHCL
ncbi:hypothetical protein [Streptomyces sp. NPDC004008]